MKRILIVNGPNLNLLGSREPEVYGRQTMDDCLAALCQQYPALTVDYYQSNVEGELINRLQAAASEVDGILINAGGYSHTSVALHDCLKAISVPAVEIHISNLAQREAFRHVSLIAAACRGTIAGFGMDSYRLGVEALLKME